MASRRELPELELGVIVNGRWMRLFVAENPSIFRVRVWRKCQRGQRNERLRVLYDREEKPVTSDTGSIHIK